MPRITKAEARKLATRLGIRPLTWHWARQQIDDKTLGAYDCWQLDKLTDWTLAERAKLGITDDPARGEIRDVT